MNILKSDRGIQMKVVKVRFIALCVMGASIFHSAALANEAFFTYPGTRAMGMAGAFTAQADNSSAVWYNPAGLSQQGSADYDITAEYGTMPTMSDTYEYSTDKSDFKFGSLTARDKNSSISYGVSYFVPYRFALYIPEKANTWDTNPIGRVDATYSQISFAGAMSGERLSIGGTLDMLQSDVKGGSGFNNGSGFGYSIGGLYKVISGEYGSLKAGAVYRSKVKIESNTAGGETVSKYLPAKPESTAFGLNLMLPFSFAIFNANAGYEKIQWSKAYPSMYAITGFDYAKNMFGGEVIVDIYGTMVSFRAGQSTSTPDDSIKYIPIKSLTYGVGISLNQNLIIDFAAEDRSLEFTSGSKKYNLSSASATYQF